MADINFVIPTSLEELLEVNGNNFYVKEVLPSEDIIPALNVAKLQLSESGAEFILTNFDVFYSVLRNSESLSNDVFLNAYNILFKACIVLEKTIVFILTSGNEMEEEEKIKMQNIIKMIFYLFIKFLAHFEDELITKQRRVAITKKSKDKDTNLSIDKSKALNIISTILQRNLNLFWTPPMAEFLLVNLIGNLCYDFLRNPLIKQEKSLILEIFGVFGNLIKDYDYGNAFCNCLINSIRTNEHISQCIGDGVKLLITEFNCKNVIHFLVKECTDWQVNAVRYDASGTKSCSTFLVQLAELCPDQMIKEMDYLRDYLGFDSPLLRTSIITIITEILIKVLRKDNLSSECLQIRHTFLQDLRDHLREINPTVRSKVIQSIARLKMEDAIPWSFEHVYLNDIIVLLKDKSSLVRKMAIQCVCVFLEYNSFGGRLEMEVAVENLKKLEIARTNLDNKYKNEEEKALKAMEAWWEENQNDVQKAVADYCQNGDDVEDSDDEQIKSLSDDVCDVVKYLKGKRYRLAAKHATALIGKYFENYSEFSIEEKITKLTAILQRFLFDKQSLHGELRTLSIMSIEDVEESNDIDNKFNFWMRGIAFLDIIHAVIPTMRELLMTTYVSDMQEALKFFVLANQFHIKGAEEGVQDLLMVLSSDDSARTDHISNALKTIYLQTDSNNIEVHAKEVLTGLISVEKNLTVATSSGFEALISEWTSKGIIDNSVIDMAWKFYTHRMPNISTEDARAACEILRKCALGRSTIIEKNIKVVTTIAEEMGKNDMLLLASSFRLLLVAVRGSIDIHSSEKPFRISYKDPVFDAFTQILYDGFFGQLEFYKEALKSGIEVIFRICSRPLTIVHNLIKKICAKISETNQVKTFIIIHLAQLIGYSALNLLVYLDVMVYRELKRRNLAVSNHNESKQKKKSRQSAIGLNTTNTTGSDETAEELEGAVAEDTDAEFILGVLENECVMETTLLGILCEKIVCICENPAIFDNCPLQKAAINAVAQCMLLSSKLCSKKIRLLFSILENTNWPEIKCNILIHTIDLLSRFPNIVEPWFDRVYKCLKSTESQVRQTAMFTITSLVLKDMVRPREHLAEIAVCLMDENEEVKQVVVSFYKSFEQKNHNLENIIPDILGQLLLAKVEEEKVRSIISFLFGLIEKQKKPEGVVDRLCGKYTLDDMTVNRNVTYSLSLVHYNEKALRVLLDKFPNFRQHLHDGEIYALFKELLVKARKANSEVKIIDDIQNAISDVFETKNGDVVPQRKSAKKTKKRN